ncbi:MAG TPA: glycosyltransferase family 4 protein [Candidatus Saccharimonadales bacterium]|nr:glycosyltransferase family 4 protein [Candidatus Saccharimonadales bacterium]
MKILFVTRKFPPSIGGMEQFAYDLHGAVSQKVETVLVSWGGSNKALPVVYPLLFVKSLLQLMKGGIDVIHIQDGLLAPAGWLLSKLSRKPYTVVIHGLDITFNNPLFKALAPPAVARASKVFCISQAAADEAIKRGVPAEKCEVIPLAVDDKLFGKATRADLIKRLELPENSQLLLTVGRLVKRKGVAWFISNVLPELAKTNPHVVYLVVGDGSERETVEVAINDSKMAGHVRLLGRVTDDLYEMAYNGADVFVMPNIPVDNNIEGFGLVVLEAALCERPVVAANTEGIADAIRDGQNGVMVTPKDSKAFEKEIKHFLDKPAEAKEFGKKARQFTLDHYQWGKIADRYADGYKSLPKRR